MEDYYSVLRRAIEQVLDSKGCTLWRDWEITNPESREKAIAWAMEFYQEVEDEL